MGEIPDGIGLNEIKFSDATAEAEKSPEDVEIEKIAMGKVVDINAFGNIITGIGNGVNEPRLNSLWKNGLVPKAYQKKYGIDAEKSVASFFQKGISLSLIGVDSQYYNSLGYKESSAALWGASERNNCISLTIDPKFIDKHRDNFIGGGGASSVRAKEAGIQSTYGLRDNWDDKSIKRSQWLGYYLDYRNTFRGCGVPDMEDTSLDEVLYLNHDIEDSKLPVEAFRGIIIGGEVKEGLIIDFIKNQAKDGLDKSIPIYDVEGNLVWPKKMSLEEIKKMLEEKKRIRKNNGCKFKRLKRSI